MTKAQPTWRKVLPVHPAADLFPMMSHDELLALGEDIKARGLISPIVLFKESVDHTDLQGYSLLDGRNRLDAMELVGIKFRLVHTKRLGVWCLSLPDLPARLSNVGLNVGSKLMNPISTYCPPTSIDGISPPSRSAS